MPDRPLRITRDAIELGTLPEAEVRELLQLGLLDLPETGKEGDSQ